jgi:hypothetical protein
VRSLTDPPAYGTPEYYRCASKWYQAYMQASYLDSYRQQIATLQAQIAQGETLLDAYVSAYDSCLNGYPA